VTPWDSLWTSLLADAMFGCAVVGALFLAALVWDWIKRSRLAPPAPERPLTMGGILSRVTEDVRRAVQTTGGIRPLSKVNASLKKDEAATIQGYLIVGLIFALTVVTQQALSKGSDQYSMIRKMRITIQYSMEPKILLGESVGNEAPFLTFMDKICTEDCSGHVAGWKWAAKHSVTKVDQCGDPKSESFFQGCQIYLWRMGYAPDPGN
jgi:hypothetical protein